MGVSVKERVLLKREYLSLREEDLISTFLPWKLVALYPIPYALKDYITYSTYCHVIPLQRCPKS